MTKKSRQKCKYLENEKNFQDEITSIFHHFWRAIIEENKKKIFFWGWEPDFIKKHIPVIIENPKCKKIICFSDINLSDIINVFESIEACEKPSIINLYKWLLHKIWYILYVFFIKNHFFCLSLNFLNIMVEIRPRFS